TTAFPRVAGSDPGAGACPSRGVEPCTEGPLLRVGYLALDERDLQIFVYVNLLGAQVDDLIRLAQDRDDFINTLAQLNRGRRGWRGCRSWRGLVCCRRLLLV